MKRFVIRDAETGTGYMDSFDTIQECVDMIKKYEKIDRKEGIYAEGFYEVYDNLEKEIVVHGYEL